MSATVPNPHPALSPHPHPALSPHPHPTPTSVRIIRPNTLATAAASTSGPAKLRVAAYCRVSTDSKEQKTSYEAQCAHYVSYIAEHPDWTLAGIYADEGITGTQAKCRPQFLRMIAACQDGHIDLVITKSISRFARNTIDCLNYIRLLKALDIPVIFEKESINTMEASGELLITILASIAQQESASISQNVKMGIRYIMRMGRGRVNFTQFLGYTEGPTKGSLAIVPAEAAIVRRIYRAYLDGLSPAKIAARLESANVPSPTGRQRWHASTIASILDNEKYCGDLLMQKYFTQDFLTHKIVRNQGQLPQYYVANHHEPIVPKAIFRQVQGERLRRGSLKDQPSQLRFGSDEALFGRLVCSICGRTLKRCTSVNPPVIVWRCCSRAQTAQTTTFARRDDDCPLRPLPEPVAKACILHAFNQLPAARNQLVARSSQLERGPLSELDRQISQKEAELRTLEAELEQLLVQAESAGKATEVPGEASVHSPQEEALYREMLQLRQAMDALNAQRATYANEHMRLRTLLELADQLQPTAGTPEPAASAAAPQHEPQPAPASCHDPEAFFRLTRWQLPATALDPCGHLRIFDDATITRVLDRVVVRNLSITVIFKAGLELTVAC